LADFAFPVLFCWHQASNFIVNALKDFAMKLKTPVVTAIIGCGLWLCVAASSAFADPAMHHAIIVVHDDAHPVVNIPEHARVIRLDTPEAILHEVSAGLPANVEQAALAAKEILDDSIHQKLHDALQDIVDAWALGVQKIPAVIVDQRYVIYGEADVTKALDAIRQYRELESE